MNKISIAPAVIAGCNNPGIYLKKKNIVAEINCFMN
jgi:hypothetical protein